MVAGIFMTIVGASLLAFYTWDRHWLIRYTLMPGMLALFTAGLARAGAWIGGKGAEFLGSAAMLRGAAIGLLPVNFMAVALLARDEAVSQKLLAVSVMGLIYVVLAGWGLWRWCRAEHPSLGAAMGGTLLVINSLVALGPMAEALKGGRVHDVVIGLGFYTGFALVAAAVIWFGLRCADAAMLRGRRVPVVLLRRPGRDLPSSIPVGLCRPLARSTHLCTAGGGGGWSRSLLRLARGASSWRDGCSRSIGRRDHAGIRPGDTRGGDVDG